MAQRDANGRLAADGMAQVLAGGGSVTLAGDSIADPKGWPLQALLAAIDKDGSVVFQGILMTSRWQLEQFLATKGLALPA